jgi:Na+-transporting methylmalonyl-CoA/oxaloacetate decarboxylase gamma subunit
MNISLDSTIKQVSEQTNIPSKKILQYLDLDTSTEINLTLAELQISEEHLKKALTEYENKKHGFYSGIALVGMSIVFISLIVVGFFIYSLQHLNFKKKKKIVNTSIGKVKVPEHISANAIIAAITAIYLHEAEAEEKNRLMLTWKRSQLSMWRATNMVESRFFETRRNR